MNKHHTLCLSGLQITGVVASLVSIVSDNPAQLRPAVLTIATSILENQTDSAAGNATVSGTVHAEGCSL